MPTLTIDNRRIEVPAGTKVIEAAELLGIMIPRFCFHPALGSVGACRVCAVSFVEGPIKGIQMSCMVNAMDGMVVSTTDAQAVDFRRHVIEWLMLNHPHDCPVCDEGGHCLLQDMTVSGGHGLRRYQGSKRTHQDQYLGPLVQHEMNRCIQCYRCSRYYQQYAGYRDLGVMGIGTRVYFGRSQPGRLESPFAGNLVDLCPTGVYTDKPSRFMGRRWDFQRSPGVCLHCSLGCNLTVSARYRAVVRHEARPNMDVNGHFMCDRGRYGYPYANAPDRPRRAMLKGAAASLAEALGAAGRRLGEIAARKGPQRVAVVGSTRSSLETLAVLTALCRERSWTGPVFQMESRKAANLHAAVRNLDADLAVSLAAVSVADTIVVLGADPLNEAPMLALSLRQARRQGAHIAVIDPRSIDLPLDFEHWPVHPLALGRVIGALISAVENGRSQSSGDQAQPSDSAIRALADKLINSRRAVIVCGTDIFEKEDIEMVALLTRALRRADTEAKLFFALDGPNAFAAGLLADTPMGLDRILERIEAGEIKALIGVESDLWANAADRRRLLDALDRLELLIILDHIASPITERADIFLPTQTVYEAGGRWINQEGRLQDSRPVLAGGEPVALTGGGDHPHRSFGKEIPEGSPKAAWRLTANLAGTMSGAMSDDRSEEDFLGAALKKTGLFETGIRSGRIDLKPVAADAASPGSGAQRRDEQRPNGALTLLLVDEIFGTEQLSARSADLAEITSRPAARMHAQTARSLGIDLKGDIVIDTGKGRLSIPVTEDDRMAPGVLVVPRNHRLAWQDMGGTRLVLGLGQVKVVAGGAGLDAE